MVISREIDYAVRIIRELNSKSLCNAADLEQAEDIGRDFVRKILGKLKKAGYVKTERGTKGGYSLIVPLSQITLWDVRNVIDSNPIINKCLLNDYVCSRNCDTPCSLHKECQRLEEIIKAEMQSKTLEEILNDNLNED